MGARQDATTEELTAAEAGREPKKEDEVKGTKEEGRPAGGAQPANVKKERRVEGKED